MERRMDAKNDYRSDLQAARKALAEASSRGTKYMACARDALWSSLQNAWAQIRTSFGK
jgi:hypothetical protein